jgi:hypothetical protein
MNVDFPEPLAPIRPYRFPFEKVTEISSKRGFDPNWMEILDVEIIRVLVLFVLNLVKR